ncbi:MAG: O-antigen ligase family protein [Candidatus Omnitrophica bacterium]|nr:O-antigen ligase family protein [Candidatus Omnitrophota bacterium]
MRIDALEVGFWLMLLGIPCSRALTEIGATVLILAWIFQKLRARDFTLKHCSLGLPVAGLALWSGLSIFWSFDRSLSSRSFISQTLEYVAIYLAIADGLQDRKAIRRILWLWIAWGGVMFFDGIVQMVRGTDLFRGDAPGLIAGGKRLTAAMKYPNDFGAYAAMTGWMAAGIGLAEWQAKRYWRSGVAWTIAWSLIAGLLLTYSRGAWIGFAFSVVVAVTLYRTRHVIPLIVAVGAIVAFLPPTYLERLLHLFDVHPGSSADERLLIWKTVLNMIRQKPFLGFGLNTFNAVFPLYKDPAIWGTPYAHNCFLQLTAELGAVGLFFFGWVLLRFFQQGWRNDQPPSWERTVALALIAGGAGYVIHSSMDTNWYSLPLAVMWWSILGSVDALHGINRNRQWMFDKEIRRIAVVRTDRLGDVLMNLPAVAALKERFHRATVHLIVRNPIHELLAKQPFADEVVPLPAGSRAGWCGIFRSALWLRRKKYDAIVVMDPSKTVHAAAFLAGIPVRVGYARKLGFLLTDSILDRKTLGQKHEVDSNLDLVRLLGATAANRIPRLRVEEQEEAALIDSLQKEGLSLSNPWIAIHPWTSDPEKQWPLASMAQLMQQLSKEGIGELILIGGPEEKIPAENFSAGFSFPVTSLVGRLSLRQLAALLKQCRTLVSNDSGPVHVAAAVGTPTVVLFTGRRPAATPKRWGPVGEGHIVLQSPHPEIPIPVEAVIAAVVRQCSQNKTRA